MAIAVGSVSNTPTYATRTNSTITAPSGITNGDVLVALLFVGDASASPALAITPPTGFVEVTNSPTEEDQADPYTIAMHVFTKTASGESGNYTFTHSSADTEGFMYRLTGANTTTHVDASPTVASGFSQTTSYADLTTVTDGCFCIYAEGTWDASSGTSVSGTTPTIARRRQGSVSLISDGTQTTAGALGARTRSSNGNSSNTPYCSIVVPIRPATAANKTIAADAGSYAVTGTAASGLHGWKPSGAAGSYAISGTAATPKRGYALAAVAGSYSITGTAASMLHAWKPAAVAGSYSINGTAASLLHGWKPAAAAGSYSITGSDATPSITSNKTIVGDAGSYALTGTAASLLHAWRPSAGAGSYALTGTAAIAAHGYKVAGLAGSYALTGVAASLLHAWKVAANGGTYAITGTAATLTLTASSRLVADAGAYSISGTAATLLHAWKISALGGSYALTGTAATLTRGQRLTAEAGSYAITGSAASMITARRLEALAGAYALTGADASLINSGVLSRFATQTRHSIFPPPTRSNTSDALRPPNVSTEWD